MGRIYLSNAYEYISGFAKNLKKNLFYAVKHFNYKFYQ